MTSMIEVAYISRDVCNTEGSLGGMFYKRNMTIDVGCGCISGSRNRYIQIESLESTAISEWGKEMSHFTLNAI